MTNTTAITAGSPLPPTAGQTVGPFFGYALPYDGGPDLVPFAHPDAVQLTGRVLDGKGEPVPDALIEIWQADTTGAVVSRPGSLHRNPHEFTGWGRCPTDATGSYSFTTVRPGGDAKFIAVTVFARGLLNRLFTRIYLPGTSDAFLASLSDAERETLVAREQDGALHFDIVLQGDRETVFLRYPGQHE